MHKRGTFRLIYDFTQGCRGILLASVGCAVISVLGGLVPYWGIYQIIRLFLEGSATGQELWSWTGVCVAGYFIKLVFYGVSTTLSHRSAYQILESLRLAMARRLMEAPLGRVLGNTAGKLKNIIVDRVETIELPLAHLIPEGISNLLLPLAVFGYMLALDWRIALASLICIPLGAMVYAFMMRNFNSQYAAFMEAGNQVNSTMVEYVEGIEVIKAFNQSSSSYAKFTGAIHSFREFTLAWFHSTWKLMNLGGAILPTTLLGILPVGIFLYVNGSLTPAELTMSIILSMSIIAPVSWFTVAVNDWKSIQYAIHDANELLNLPVLPDAAKPGKPANYEVQLRNVSFRYQDHSSDVLQSMMLTLPSGSFTALVGPSGSGKSTVARLIARFWDVTGGEIRIGGVNIREIPLKQLSGLISYVAQDNFLFDCSLLENIRLGKPTAADEEVYAAARAAQCEAFISRLEQGWHTQAGEAGGKLSGGERQRIAIARAILKDAPIVILDEATAFTDPENEEQLQKSIAALTAGKTLLVIAHRLSTIKEADQIVVLQQGQIAGIGTQAELLAECPLYRDMWEAHVGAKSWAASSRREGGMSRA